MLGPKNNEITEATSTQIVNLTIYNIQQTFLMQGLVK